MFNKKDIEYFGDDFLHCIIFIYEDSSTMFELSQTANSCYFYDIFGYRFNRYNQGKSRNNCSNNKKILAIINCILLNCYHIKYRLCMIDVIFLKNRKLNFMEQKLYI